MFQLQFLLQRKYSMLIFETIFEKVSQFGFIIIHAYFQAMLIFKQALIIARLRYLYFNNLKALKKLQRTMLPGKLVKLLHVNYIIDSGLCIESVICKSYEETLVLTFIQTF